MKMTKTDNKPESQPPDDGIGRAYVQHCVAKTTHSDPRPKCQRYQVMTERRLWSCWVIGKVLTDRMFTDWHSSHATKRKLQHLMTTKCETLQTRDKHEDVKTGVKSFAELNHLHQSNAYDSGLGVVAVLETVHKPSAKSHDVLAMLHDAIK